MAIVSKADNQNRNIQTTTLRVEQRAPRYMGSFSDYAVISNTSSTSIDYQRERAWQADTQFKVLKASGAILPDRPYSFFEQRPAKINGTVSGPIAAAGTYRTRTQYRVRNVSIAASPAPATLSASSLYSKLVEKAKGAQVNVPVFLAEATKTSSMIVARATTLVNAMRMARRGNFQGMVDQLHVTYRPRGQKKVREWNRRFHKDGYNSLSKIWLEARYGWLPFYSEVYSAGELLSELQERQNDFVQRVTAGARSKSVSSVTGTLLLNYVADGGLRMDVNYTFEEELRVRWRFIPLELDGLGRFGLTNPALVAWELVPFSFVADWFLPIGSYLNDLDLSSRFRHVGGSVGRVLKTTAVYTNPRQAIASPSAYVNGFPSSFTVTNVSVTRQPLSGAPITSLEDISFQPRLNAKRVVDSIALLSQQARRLSTLRL